MAYPIQKNHEIGAERLVRSHLEYANSVWYPKNMDVEKLEGVQNRAKLMPEISKKPYRERLQVLNIYFAHTEVQAISWGYDRSRVARSPVFYEISRISDPYSRLPGKPPGRTIFPYSVSQIVASLRRHCDT